MSPGAIPLRQPRTRPLDWIEISADYRCNNRCVGCFSVQDNGDSMSTREAVESLVIGRQRGARFLWLGGGDPTLRKDLLTLVKQARRLGYEKVKLETNGMLLAYPTFARACVDAGVTEINFSIKGHTAELHDRLTATPGCFDLMCKGIENMRSQALSLEGDVLVYRSNQMFVPDIVKFFFEQGIQRFNLWLFSTMNDSETTLTEQVPTIAEVMPWIIRAIDLGLSETPDFIASLHTPPCTIPVGYERCRFHPARLNLLVMNPGGYRFMLEESPIEGGHYTSRCGQCTIKTECNGMRSAYVRQFGDTEFQPR